MAITIVITNYYFFLKIQQYSDIKAVAKKKLKKKRIPETLGNPYLKCF